MNVILQTNGTPLYTRLYRLVRKLIRLNAKSLCAVKVLRIVDTGIVSRMKESVTYLSMVSEWMQTLFHLKYMWDNVVFFSFFLKTSSGFLEF